MTVLIVIGIIIGLGFLMVFPRMTLGVLAAVFCIWRGWWIAAGICLLVGFCLSILKDGGHNSSTDYSEFHDEPDSSDGLSPFEAGVVLGALSDKDKNN